VGWAGPGGVALGWALSDRTSAADWAARMALFAVLIVLCLDPVVDLFGELFLRLCPDLIFPHSDLNIYANRTSLLNPDQQRTVYTNSQNTS
jgi:hypothetical protein